MDRSFSKTSSFTFLRIFIIVCVIVFCQAKSAHDEDFTNSLEPPYSRNLPVSTRLLLDPLLKKNDHRTNESEIKWDKNLSQSVLIRKIRNPKCKCFDESYEEDLLLMKPVTSTTQKTPKTYRPPRVQDPLEIEDESIEWVESGVTPVQTG